MDVCYIKKYIFIKKNIKQNISFKLSNFESMFG